MARHPLLITLACVAGAAATIAVAAAESTPQSLPAAVVAPVTAAATDAAPEVGWLDRYGTYNVRQGTWILIPSGEGC